MGKVGRFLCSPIRAVRCAFAKIQSDRNEQSEALTLLHACENSRLATLTSRNSSTAHLLEPRFSPPPAAVGGKKRPRIMRSATLVRVVSHTTLGAAPSGSLDSYNQQAAKRPPMISRDSTKSILKSSNPSGPTQEFGMRRSSRRGSAVSWTVPLLSQIGEDGTIGSSSASGVDVATAESPISPTPIVGGVQVEEDRIIGGSLVRIRTKLFRRMSFSSGEEEFEEILVDGRAKQVIFVWGDGVDDLIP